MPHPGEKLIVDVLTELVPKYLAKIDPQKRIDWTIDHPAATVGGPLRLNLWMHALRTGRVWPLGAICQIPLTVEDMPNLGGLILAGVGEIEQYIEDEHLQVITRADALKLVAAHVRSGLGLLHPAEEATTIPEASP